MWWLLVAACAFRAPVALKPSWRRPAAPIEMPARKELAVKSLVVGSLIVQSAGVSLLAQHMCRRVTYSGAAVSFLQELLKLPLVVLVFALTGRLDSLLPVLKRAYLKPRELLQLFVPATCFAAQNVLFFVAHQRISATTYLVLSQTKTLFTALFTVLLLPKKRFRAKQWIAQPILAAGCALVLLPQMASNTAATAALPSFIVGVNAALTSAVLSGFANVYFERLVKSEVASFWARQLQLSTATAFFTIPALPKGEPLLDLVAAFTPGVWAIVGLKCLGGILVGATIRYTSAVSKNFATATAIALTAACQPAVAANPSFQAGLIAVFTSMALFNWPAAVSPPPSDNAKTTKSA